MGMGKRRRGVAVRRRKSGRRAERVAAQAEGLLTVRRFNEAAQLCLSLLISMPGTLQGPGEAEISCFSVENGSQLPIFRHSCPIQSSSSSSSSSSSLSLSPSSTSCCSCYRPAVALCLILAELKRADEIPAFLDSLYGMPALVPVAVLLPSLQSLISHSHLHAAHAFFRRLFTSWRRPLPPASAPAAPSSITYSLPSSSSLPTPLSFSPSSSSSSSANSQSEEQSLWHRVAHLYVFSVLLPLSLTAEAQTFIAQLSQLPPADRDALSRLVATRIEDLQRTPLLSPSPSPSLSSPSPSPSHPHSPSPSISPPLPLHHPASLSTPYALIPATPTSFATSASPLKLIGPYLHSALALLPSSLQKILRGPRFWICAILLMALLSLFSHLRRRLPLPDWLRRSHAHFLQLFMGPHGKF